MIQVHEHGAEAASLLAALHAEAFADPAATGPAWTASAFIELLGTPGTLALVATLEDEPLGLLLLRTVLDEAEILTVGTRPGGRRQGVGRVLVTAAMARAVALGARSLFLEVAETNLPARSLYETCGFGPVGRRKGYYHLPGGPVDALVLQRPLA